MRRASAWSVVVGVLAIWIATPSAARAQGFWTTIAAGGAGSSTPSDYTEFWFDSPHGPPLAVAQITGGFSAQATTAGGTTLFTPLGTPVLLPTNDGYATLTESGAAFPTGGLPRFAGGSQASGAPLTAQPLPTDSNMLSAGLGDPSGDGSRVLTVGVTDPNGTPLGGGQVSVPDGGWWVIGIGPGENDGTPPPPPDPDPVPDPDPPGEPPPVTLSADDGPAARLNRDRSRPRAGHDGTLRSWRSNDCRVATIPQVRNPPHAHAPRKPLQPAEAFRIGGADGSHRYREPQGVSLIVSWADMSSVFVRLQETTDAALGSEGAPILGDGRSTKSSNKSNLRLPRPVRGSSSSARLHIRRPTEIVAFSERIKEFRDRAGRCSRLIDSQFSHLAWIQTPRTGRSGRPDLSAPCRSD